MHVAFAGVVADDAVDHDVFFALAEPAVLAPEPALGLGRRRGQIQEGNEADQAGDETFQGEEPAPAREAVVAAQVEDAEGEEGGDYAGELVRDPEEAEADGQFEAGVEVAEVEDVVGDEAAFQHTQQCSTREERGAPAEEGLHAGDETPRDHLDGDPAVRTELFGDELGWQFGAEKANVENGLPRIVIVGVYLEIVEHVVG